MPVVSTLAIVHAEAPPVGLVEVTTLPNSSVATHREALGHETLKSSSLVPSIAAGAVQTPPVGLVEVITLPFMSTATQSETLGHEIPTGKLEPSASAVFHVEAPPVGLVEVITSPWLSSATHSETLGHAMSVSWYPGPAPDDSDVVSAVRVPVAINTPNRIAMTLRNREFQRNSNARPPGLI
jgi:hypothetical protein